MSKGATHQSLWDCVMRAPMSEACVNIHDRSPPKNTHEQERFVPVHVELHMYEEHCT